MREERLSSSDAGTEPRVVGKGPCTAAAHASFHDITHQFLLITNSDIDNHCRVLFTRIEISVSERVVYTMGTS